MSGPWCLAVQVRSVCLPEQRLLAPGEAVASPVASVFVGRAPQWGRSTQKACGSAGLQCLSAWPAPTSDRAHSYSKKSAVLWAKARPGREGKCTVRRSAKTTGPSSGPQRSPTFFSAGRTGLDRLPALLSTYKCRSASAESLGPGGRVMTKKFAMDAKFGPLAAHPPLPTPRLLACPAHQWAMASPPCTRPGPVPVGLGVRAALTAF